MKFIKRSWVIGLILILVSLIGVGGYFLFASKVGVVTDFQGSDSVSNEYAVARRGNLTISVAGVGELIANETTDLSFSNQGVVTEIFVKPGENVQAGDVLAEMKINQSEAELAAEISSANLAVLQAQQELDQLHANAQLQSAQAWVNLKTAEDELFQLQENQLELAQAEKNVALAEQEVESAQMAQYIVNAYASQATIDVAHASLLFKEKDLADIQDQIAKINNQLKGASDHEREQLVSRKLNLQVQLANLQIDYDARLAHYNSLIEPADPFDQTLADSQLNTALLELNQAQKTLEKIMAGPTSGEMAIAVANLTKAQTEWEKAKDGTDSVEISMAEEKLAAAQARLSLAQHKELTQDLVAPYSGRVIAINVNPGNQVQNESILTIANIDPPLVEVYIDETDLAQVQIGNPVEISFDALPDITFTGLVSSIDPQLQHIGINSGVRVLVQFDEQYLENIRSLPIGLNASADIIVGQASNAVLIPIEALKQNTAGEYFVYVISSENTFQQSVTVGLRDYTSAEITSGLYPGDSVVVGELPQD